MDYFKNTPSVEAIDWDTWFNSPGMPTYKPKYDESKAKVCQALKDKWVAWRETEPSFFGKSDLDELTAGQKIEFLALLLLEEPLW